MEHVKALAWLPAYIFDSKILQQAVSLWNWCINENADCEVPLFINIVQALNWTTKKQRGLFSSRLNLKDPWTCKFQYAPSDKESKRRISELATNVFFPHVIWFRFLHSHFETSRHTSPDIFWMYVRLTQLVCEYGQSHMSHHPLAREGIFTIINLGMKLLLGRKLDLLFDFKIRAMLFDLAFNWFSLPPMYVID